MGRHVQASLPLEPKLVECEAFFLQSLKVTKLTYSTDVISSLPVCREHLKCCASWSEFNVHQGSWKMMHEPVLPDYRF